MTDHEERRTRMTVVGIDPGMMGALIAIDGNQIVNWLDMPTIEIGKTKDLDAHTIRDWLTQVGPVDMVVVEHVQGVQGSGATSAFNFGAGWGMLRGLLVGMDRPVTLVRPQRWTKDLAVGADKGAHRRFAQSQWPASAQLFTRVKDDGRADAACLAHWWMRGNR